MGIGIVGGDEGGDDLEQMSWRLQKRAPFKARRLRMLNQIDHVELPSPPAFVVPGLDLDSAHLECGKHGRGAVALGARAEAARRLPAGQPQIACVPHTNDHQSTTQVLPSKRQFKQFEEQCFWVNCPYRRSRCQLILQHAVELEIGVPRTAITIAKKPRPQRLVGAETGIAPDRTVRGGGSGDPVVEARDVPPGAPRSSCGSSKRTRRTRAGPYRPA